MMKTPKKGKTLPLLLLLALIAACSLFLLPNRQESRPLVYDCFLFYNELELLEIRLHEMSGKVDKFVLVEANETFRGNPKKFFFAENQRRFEKFADKIIYVPINDHFATDDPWERENYQRNQVMRGLKKCKGNDIVLLSDVDEIVREKNLADIIEAFQTKKADFIVCEQMMYWGYLNRLQSKENLWPGTTALCYQDMKRISPMKLRKMRKMRSRQFKKNKIFKPLSLPNSGWHFTSLGGVDRYITKIESFSHSELDTSEHKNPEHVAKLLKSYPLVTIDESFPKFVRENQEYLKSMGLIDSR